MKTGRTPKFQLCWYCSKACNGGCSWSREFKPVSGWIAEPTYWKANGIHAESYKITSCPEFVRDRK